MASVFVKARHCWYLTLILAGSPNAEHYGCKAAQRVGLAHNGDFVYPITLTW